MTPQQLCARLFDTEDLGEWQRLAREHFVLDGSLIAEDEHGLVGFITVARDGTFLICVRPDARSKGIGSALLRAASPLDFARQHYTAEGRALVEHFKKRETP